MHWRLSWYLKQTRLRHPPQFINLEPTNACNLSCIWCVADRSRTKGMLSLSLAENILDQAAAAKVREVRLFLAGEPLLYPHITALVSLVNERNLKSVIHTNAMLLTEEMSNDIIGAGLSEISFSVNGITSREVSENQPGADLYTMIANIRTFLSLSNNSPDSVTSTILQIIRRRHDRQRAETRRFIRETFIQERPDRILLLEPHSWSGQLTSCSEDSKHTVYHPCQPLWQGMSIGWDGRVFLCCGDLNGSVPVGDMTRSSLMEIWLGTELTEARCAVAGNKRANRPLCSSCDAVWWNKHPLMADMRRAAWRLTGGMDR